MIFQYNQTGPLRLLASYDSGFPIVSYIKRDSFENCGVVAVSVTERGEASS